MGIMSLSVFALSLLRAVGRIGLLTIEAERHAGSRFLVGDMERGSLRDVGESIRDFRRTGPGDIVPEHNNRRLTIQSY